MNPFPSFVRCEPATDRPRPFPHCIQIISSHPHEHCMSAATFDGIWRSALAGKTEGSHSIPSSLELNHLDP